MSAGRLGPVILFAVTLGAVVFSPAHAQWLELRVHARPRHRAGVRAGRRLRHGRIPRNDDMIESLQRMRVAIREKTKCAVVAGFGPRFQHSTGQFHKGGPDSGLFIQIITDTKKDISIPNEGMTFGTLIRAQASGDYETLVARKRRVIRIHLSKPEDIRLLVKALQ